MKQLSRSSNRMIVWLFVLLLSGCSLSKNQDTGLKIEERPEEKTTEKKATAVTDANREVMTNSIGMQFKRIPEGSFLMGSPMDEKDREDDENPQHKVTLTQPFYLGVYEVTQEQYEKVMGVNPSEFKGAKLPVERVSWDDAQDFCKKLSKREENMIYRLPTEAEWEYACRAGTKDAYYWGNHSWGRHAWCKENGEGKTHEVGTRQPNAWGLYDMGGNVWEWCADWYAAYPAGEQEDPKGAATGLRRVFRGGSWIIAPKYCRSANRSCLMPGVNYNSAGFRVVVIPPWLL